MITFSETNNFELRYDSRYGYGDIRRKVDGVTTALFTGSEGYEDLARVALAHTLHGAAACDHECAQYFYPGATAYVGSEYGHIGVDGQWKAGE